MSEMDIIDRRGIYFKIAGDERWHVDNGIVEKLRRQIPDYWDDTCPNCGMSEGITGCRCIVNHRTCPRCNITWHWEIDRNNAVLKVIQD